MALFDFMKFITTKKIIAHLIYFFWLRHWWCAFEFWFTDLFLDL